MTSHQLQAGKLPGRKLAQLKVLKASHKVCYLSIDLLRNSVGKKSIRLRRQQMRQSAGIFKKTKSFR